MKGILWISAMGLLALSCERGTPRSDYAACCEQCTCGCGGQELCPLPRTIEPLEFPEKVTLGLIIGVGVLAIAVMAYGAYLKVIAGMLVLLVLPYACAHSTTEQTEVPPILRWEATGNPGGPCLYVAVAGGVQQDAGTIALAIRAQNLQDASEITGGLVFSRTVLQYTGWYRGDWLDDPACSIAYKEGLVTFEARGRTPRSGSGEVLVLMFRALEGARGESTRMLWYQPAVDGDVVAVLGGAVHVE